MKTRFNFWGLSAAMVLLTAAAPARDYPLAEHRIPSPTGIVLPRGMRTTEPERNFLVESTKYNLFAGNFSTQSMTNSVRKWPNIVGFYMAWGADGACQGRPEWWLGFNPDFIDWWLVDDQDEWYYAGNTGYGQNPDYPSGPPCSETGIYFQNEPLYQNTCGTYYCPMLDGYIYAHINH